jgi:hypothetical protein
MTDLLERGVTKLTIAAELTGFALFVPNVVIGLGALGIGSVVGQIGAFQTIAGLGERLGDFLDDDPGDPTIQVKSPGQPKPALSLRPLIPRHGL